MTNVARPPMSSCRAVFPYEQYLITCSINDGFTPKQLTLLSRFHSAYDDLLHGMAVGSVVDIDVKSNGVCITKLATAQDDGVAVDMASSMLDASEITKCEGFGSGDDFAVKVRRCLAERFGDLIEAA